MNLCDIIKITFTFNFWMDRLDFLATYAAEHIDGGLIARELETMLGCHVGLAKDLEGKETEANSGGQGRSLNYNVWSIV